jgi:hypothetical protein
MVDSLGGDSDRATGNTEVTIDTRPTHSSTLVCDRKFGPMWISTERRASDEEKIV